MNWELISHYAVPPLVGAVIGYFTNMIAVKMLFFPHEEKHIFGWRVPFTPGAIPKGKERLAKAAGEILAILKAQDCRVSARLDMIKEDISL